MAKFKAIIFDLGNVLINYNINSTFETWANLTSYDFDFFRNHFKIDKQLKEYEKGKISSFEYYRHILNMFDIDMAYKIFKEGWNSIQIDKGANLIGILKDLRPKFNLYILTNTNELHEEFWRFHFPELLSYFDDVFCSHKLHKIKPEPKIFLSVLKKINIQPQNTIFIDDKQENVVASNNIGMTSILYKNPSDLKKKLNQYGVI